jgi:phosphatidylglycerophosphate synthase
MSLKIWDIFHCMAVSTGLIIYHVTGSIIPVLIIISLSVFLLWISQWHSISHFKPAGGYANMVTLFRFILVIVIVTISGILTVKSIGILLIIPVSLDGLDGFLARRMNQKSEFGALFDMEADSLFVAFAGLILVDKHIAGAWILPVVYMRYIYILVILTMGLNEQPEKQTRFGPSVAVFLFISLLTGYLIPQRFATPMMAVASLLVIMSFSYSFFKIVSGTQNP